MLNKRFLLGIFIIAFLIISTVITPVVRAEDSGYRYVISATNPTNGATNVPQNLQSGATGSTCSTSSDRTICTVMVGLGISPNNPTSGVGYPNIVSASINSNTISISSTNDSGLSAKFSGSQECGGCGDFYHSFSFYIAHTNFPNGVELMPNTTYTITIKSGESGLKTYYSSNFQNYEALLDSDYSWSFATGDGSIPSREVEPTPTPTPTSTPSPTHIPSATSTPTSMPTSSTNQNNTVSPASNTASTPTTSITKLTSQTKIKTAQVEGVATNSALTNSKLPTVHPALTNSEQSFNSKLIWIAAFTSFTVLSFGLFLSRSHWLKMIKNIFKKNSKDV